MKITEVPERCPVCDDELAWTSAKQYFDCKGDPYKCFYGKSGSVVFFRLENGMGIKFRFDDKMTHIWTNNASFILTFPFVDPSLEYSEVNAYAERLLKLKTFL